VEQQPHMISSSPPASGDRAVGDRTQGLANDQANDQALAWIMRLASGRATTDDAEALQRWRAESPMHRRAFAEAKLLWEALGPAAQHLAQQGRSAEVRKPRDGSPRLVGRRGLIGGALAASFAAAGYVGSKPPFRFWPSLDELQADYRTATGERRQLVLADDLSVTLNTQTSIGVGPAVPGSRVIELISGEAAVTANANRSSFDIVAAGGRVTAAVARFDMRRSGRSVRVTCLDGVVDVACHDRSVTVPPEHQVTYDADGLGTISTIDLAVVTAWQQGQLVFRHEPLARVLEEINRYRPGRILLLNEKLGERDVVATFHLDRIDDVIAHLAEAFDARARFLPGGVVVLS
jgi:transmembrane sensor